MKGAKWVSSIGHKFNLPSILSWQSFSADFAGRQQGISHLRGIVGLAGGNRDQRRRRPH